MDSLKTIHDCYEKTRLKTGKPNRQAYNRLISQYERYEQAWCSLEEASQQAEEEWRFEQHEQFRFVAEEARRHAKERRHQTHEDHNKRAAEHDQREEANSDAQKSRQAEEAQRLTQEKTDQADAQREAELAQNEEMCNLAECRRVEAREASHRERQALPKMEETKRQEDEA